VFGVAIDAQGLRQLQVYRYPFSVATSQPEIPDGKVTQSFGIKQQISFTQLAKDQVFVVVPLLV
jgi:hypothetical protein